MYSRLTTHFFNLCPRTVQTRWIRIVENRGNNGRKYLAIFANLNSKWCKMWLQISDHFQNFFIVLRIRKFVVRFFSSTNARIMKTGLNFPPTSEKLPFILGLRPRFRKLVSNLRPVFLYFLSTLCFWINKIKISVYLCDREILRWRVGSGVIFQRILDTIFVSS